MVQSIDILVKLRDKFSKPSKEIDRRMIRIKTLSKRWGTSVQDINNAMKNMGIGMKTNTQLFDVFSGQTIETRKNLRKLRMESQRISKMFKFQFLGLLFGGMMLQRTFEGIARTGISSFQKISQGQSEASQALIGLSAGFEFLKFSIGEALGTALIPILPSLLAIFEGVSDFISQHPEAVFIAISGAITAGGFIVGLSSLKLFLESVKLFQTSGDLKSFLSTGGGLDKLTKVAAGVIALKVVFEVAEEIFKGELDVEDMAKALTQLTGAALLFQPDPLLKALGIVLVLMPELFPEQFGDVIKIIQEEIFKLYEAIKEKFQEVVEFMANSLQSIPILNQFFAFLGGVGPTPFFRGGPMPFPNLNKAFKPGVFGKLDDFIITNGRVFKTNPQDTIIGSKGRESFGDINITINTGPVGSDVDVEALAERVGDVIAEKVRASVNPAVTKFLR